MRPRSVPPAVTWVLVLAMVGFGCGHTPKGALTGALTPLGERLPASVQESRILKVGSSLTYPPIDFSVEGEPAGVDVDLCEALAGRFGPVKCQFQNTTFDGIVQALLADRFSIIMSALTATDQRRSEVDFIEYFETGVSILVQAGNPDGIESPTDLCGRIVGVQRGTTAETTALTQAEACRGEDLGELAVVPFKNDPAARDELRSGLIDAALTDFPVANLAARCSGGGDDFEVIGEALTPGRYGIGVRKDDGELRQALAEALAAVMADGTYARILQKWGVAEGALEPVAAPDDPSGARCADPRP